MTKALRGILIAIILLFVTGCTNSNKNDTMFEDTTTISPALLPERDTLIEKQESETTIEKEEIDTSAEKEESQTSTDKKEGAAASVKEDTVTEADIRETTAPKDEGNVTTVNNVNTELITVDIPEAESDLIEKYNRDYWPTLEWKTSSPEEQGIDSAILEKTNSDILAKRSKIRSLLIIKNG
jgi:PBP1b-binding outer membrane lipoprotein LpoB